MTLRTGSERLMERWKKIDSDMKNNENSGETNAGNISELQTALQSTNQEIDDLQEALGNTNTALGNYQFDQQNFDDIVNPPSSGGAGFLGYLYGFMSRNKKIGCVKMSINPRAGSTFNTLSLASTNYYYVASCPGNFLGGNPVVVSERYTDNSPKTLSSQTGLYFLGPIRSDGAGEGAYCFYDTISNKSYILLSAYADNIMSGTVVWMNTGSEVSPMQLEDYFVDPLSFTAADSDSVLSKKEILEKSKEYTDSSVEPLQNALTEIQRKLPKDDYPNNIPDGNITGENPYYPNDSLRGKFKKSQGTLTYSKSSFNFTETDISHYKLDWFDARAAITILDRHNGNIFNLKNACWDYNAIPYDATGAFSTIPCKFDMSRCLQIGYPAFIQRTASTEPSLFSGGVYAAYSSTDNMTYILCFNPSRDKQSTNQQYIIQTTFLIQ